MKCPKCHSDNPDTVKFCGECGGRLDTSEGTPIVHTQTVETAVEELTTGSTFAGRYQIIEELGKGGMGKVYKVHDLEIKEKIALKLIKPELAADKDTIERFRNELKLARNISHKHVCRMYDLNREAGTYFLTMEYIPGEDLKSMIRMSKQMTVGTAVCIARQICDGLAAAHKAGIVHRDLKPNNIMLDKEGNVRIMDFGIARSLSSKGITGKGVMIGTPEYMSPEQVEAKEIDSRTDIYSLGIILYEMLTGSLPFEADTPFAVGVKQKSEPPEDPRELNPRIAPELSALILKCLEKDKENRFHSVSEIDNELAKIEQGIPTTEKLVADKKTRASREITVQLSPRRILIPALVIIAAIVVVAFLWTRRSGGPAVAAPTDRPSLAIVYFENNSGDSNLDNWRSGLCELLITDLSQSKYLHVVSGDRVYGILEKNDLLGKDKYNTEDLQKVAAQGGAKHILRGSFMTAGEKFIVNVSLLKAETAEVVSSISEEGLGEVSITSSVDKITRRVKSALELSPQLIRSDIDKDIGLVTTSSPEAFRYYVEGIRYDKMGDYPKVIEYMQKAVAIDPEFASAYHVLSWAYGNQGYRKEDDKYMKKAFDLSERLSDREHYWIQGSYYLESEQTYHLAEEALLKLVELYPDDISGFNYLGVLYVRMGDRDKAIKHYQKAMDLGTEDVVVYSNLANVYLAKGMFEEERRIRRSYIEKVSDNPQPHIRLSRSYRYQGRYEQALKELDKAIALDPDSWVNKSELAVLYLYTGEWAEAAENAAELMNSREAVARSWGIWYTAVLSMLRGKLAEAENYMKMGIEDAETTGQRAWIRTWHRVYGNYLFWTGQIERALDEFDLAWKYAIEDNVLGSQRTILFLKGRAYINQGDLDTAQSLADELKERGEKAVNPNRIINYYSLQGCIDLEKKDCSSAVDYFKKVLARVSAVSGAIPFVTESLAKAYYLSGDLENAIKEYTRLTQLGFSREDFILPYVKAFFNLGKIYEQQGNTAKALENYDKFLDLWKDADPGIPEVEDARVRRKALQR
jgi:serine/threonine protein kinase/tetratricopeptide (TPR) repeat protein